MESVIRDRLLIQFKRTNLPFSFKWHFPPKVNINFESDTEPCKIKLKCNLPTPTAVKHVSKFAMRNKCTLMYKYNFHMKQVGLLSTHRMHGMMLRT